MFIWSHHQLGHFAVAAVTTTTATMAEKDSWSLAQNQSSLSITDQQVAHASADVSSTTTTTTTGTSTKTTATTTIATTAVYATPQMPLPPPPPPPPPPFFRLLDLERYTQFEHRGGWTAVIQGLHAAGFVSLTATKKSKGQGNESTVGLVDFGEDWFVMNRKKRVIREPWVGFVHLLMRSTLPPHLQTLDRFGVLDFTLDSGKFRQSAPYCRALFVFTQGMADQISAKLDSLRLKVKVCVVPHPMGVEASATRYNPTTDLMPALSKTSAVVLLGQQYRRLASLHKLVTARRKIWLPSFNDATMLARLQDRARTEAHAENVTLDDRVEIQRLAANDDYDTFVRQNIVLVDLWAAGANNAVMEGLALQAPFLVRKLDGPVEYLGEDYPLFFSFLG
jgi:hypothetical protein